VIFSVIAGARVVGLMVCGNKIVCVDTVAVRFVVKKANIH